MLVYNEISLILISSITKTRKIIGKHHVISEITKNREEIKEEREKVKTIEKLRERLEDVADMELRRVRNPESKV